MNQLQSKQESSKNFEEILKNKLPDFRKNKKEENKKIETLKTKEESDKIKKIEEESKNLETETHEKAEKISKILESGFDDLLAKIPERNKEKSKFIEQINELKQTVETNDLSRLNEEKANDVIANEGSKSRLNEKTSDIPDIKENEKITENDIIGNIISNSEIVSKENKFIDFSKNIENYVIQKKNTSEQLLAILKEKTPNILSDLFQKENNTYKIFTTTANNFSELKNEIKTSLNLNAIQKDIKVDNGIGTASMDLYKNGEKKYELIVNSDGNYQIDNV